MHQTSSSRPIPASNQTQGRAPDAKSVVQRQFGAHAQEYATSPVHAKGASLARLVELLQPQPEWHVLDVATAAGHTAFVVAPHVASVIATDITPEMIPVAQEVAAARAIVNVEFRTADAEDLPFADETFDLVTCRIAPHHFPHVDRFVAETWRVLRPGGRLAVVDNVVPGGDSATPAGRRLQEAGNYVNAFEQRRDPSHVRCLSVDEWHTCLTAAGFAVQHSETALKRMEFDPWVRRMGADPARQDKIRRMLLQAPQHAADYFRVEGEGAALAFHLMEAIFVAQKPGA